MFKIVKSNEKGFTLIELMIVIAIIGILAAIAIPQFAAYRMRGYNASGQSDVRNLATSESAFFADWQVFGVTAAAPAGAATAAGAILLGPSTATTLLTQFAGGGARSTQIPLGNGVRLIANTTATYANFLTVAKHNQGDTYFGTDGATTAVYQLNVPGSSGTALAAGVVPAVTVDDDFALAAQVTAGWIAK